ncbi:relaxase domain-containing protein [Streptomyces sp. NPDC047071]|uniref:relaxase domain-containing protein n=1 Tax=Streptomyces sp. NPDC047071 TaxID=3154808 RepID=UPI003455A11F
MECLWTFTAVKAHVALLLQRRSGRRRPSPGQAAARRSGRGRGSARRVEGPGTCHGRLDGWGCGERAAGRAPAGGGRHPDADRVERELLAAGESPERAWRATVPGRPIEHNRSPRTEKAKERTPWLAMDLTFRAPSTAQIAWALLDDARGKALAMLEDAVAQIRRGSGGECREPVWGGLIVAVFRHCESRTGQPMLHDHALVSFRVRRLDGKWGTCTRALRGSVEYGVAASALYNEFVMAEACEALGLASEPWTVTAGCRPVMDVVGVPHELIR